MKAPLFVFAALVLAPFADATAPELLWETNGFVGPESVVYDAGRNQYYVSNMGSYGRNATPADGFVSRVTADGQLSELRWVTGFEDPKGLALANGRLYVGDVAELVEIDLASGQIVGRYAPSDGRGDFNDCTADAVGNVYVCSGRLMTVFRLHAGVFEPWAKLEPAQTGSINGLRAEEHRLLLGGWSIKDASGVDRVGHLSFVNFADKSVGRLGTTPVCHIDGIEPDGHGGFTVTDWLTGEVFQVSAAGEPRLLMRLPAGAADHTYRVATRQLLVPLMKDHVLRCYRWAPDGTP